MKYFLIKNTVFYDKIMFSEANLRHVIDGITGRKRKYPFERSASVILKK